MGKLLFTVLTPTYNRAHTLHRVYESIGSQTLQKLDGEYCFEWIVVDDGSTDNTKELVQKWQNEVDWPIRYIYQENRGKPWALQRGIQEVKGLFTLIADSDDAFLPHTFETFYKVWEGLSADEREMCGGIAVLCQDQNGERVGCDFPKEGLLPALPTVLRWRSIGLGETWAALKSKNLKWAFTAIPSKAKGLKFIPESFFWDRILFGRPHQSFFLNEVLRIYYRGGEDNLSIGIRERYPEGFCFESSYFVSHHWRALYYAPLTYFKHLVKLFYFCIWKRLYR
ncbi:MAG: hypothetical protein C6I00_03000 [Nitratiruptor sp.]|nr:hypothetical protein [Nitratiruptor sp.]NPA84322.1 glycosyltransferase family 2 protein [Campylobacterota bacterium]